MPAIRTTGRSSSIGSAGLALLGTGIGVCVIYAVVAIVADSRECAEMQASLQLAANAAAEGSVAQLAKGTVAVECTARRILESRRAKSAARMSIEPNIQTGHWEREGEAFSTGREKPNAVRVTIRLRSEPRFLSSLRGLGDRQIEVHAVAVLKPAGTSLVAEATPSDSRR